MHEQRSEPPDLNVALPAATPRLRFNGCDGGYGTKPSGVCAKMRRKEDDVEAAFKSSEEDQSDAFVRVMKNAGGGGAPSQSCFLM